MRDFRFPRLWRGIGWAMVLALIVLCLIPLPPGPVKIENSDKLYHTTAYAVLALWNAWLFASRRRLLRAASGLIFLGIGIEGLQALLPWRSADFWDVVANSSGVLMGSLAAWTPMANWLWRVEFLFPGAGARLPPSDS